MKEEEQEANFPLPLTESRSCGHIRNLDTARSRFGHSLTPAPEELNYMTMRRLPFKL